MPALDFPSSPANGQVYGQYTYDSTKGAWRVTANPAATVVSSPTAPSSPVAGNLWLNTNDGVLFVYYNDGDTSQWVEVKSNTASGSTVAARVDALEAKPNGLVPIIPTSVAVGSGTASVAADGTVTFTGASSVSLNGIFTSAYKNYQIMYDVPTRSTNSFSFYRLRLAGTDSSTGYDRTISAYTNVNTPQANANTNGTDFGFAITTTAINNTIMEIMSPALAVPTIAHARWIEGTSGSAIYSNWAHGYHRSSTAYDGFTALNGSGTVTGTFRVYGYR